MSGAISLQKSVRTCDVNTGEAIRIHSDRFQNPVKMVCIPWNGMNNKGQSVCPDSYYTKTPGCNSAEDRVLVENQQRPKYVNYVTLGAEGISGTIYGSQTAHANSLARDKFNNSRNQLSGNFGKQWGANVEYSGCTVGAYERAMASANTAGRKEAYLNNAYRANQYQQAGGNY